jgi:hypothetical protein
MNSASSRPPRPFMIITNIRPLANPWFRRKIQITKLMIAQFSNSLEENE